MSGPDCEECGEYFLDCICKKGNKKSMNKKSEITIDYFWLHIIQMALLVAQCFGFIDISWGAVFIPYYLLFIIALIETLGGKETDGT